MNPYAIFQLAQDAAGAFIEEVNSPSETYDEDNILAELDKEKKYHFYGVEFGELEEHLRTGRIELGVSERLYQVRVHEYCTMASVMEPYGINMFANPNWDYNIFMRPGADALIMTVLDLNHSTDYRLMFSDATIEGQLDPDKDIKTISLKPVLDGAKQMVYDGTNDINTALEAKILVFDEWRPKLPYDRNGETLRVFINYNHIPYTDKGETKYADFAIIYYKYKTRLE